MYTPITSSLRYTEPKIELTALDRRAGAYPTKARTGDRTRTGRNKFYFDDTRTVLFLSGVKVNYPSGFQVGANVDNDLTGSIGAVTGSVMTWAVDQWIAAREQVEAPGPFYDNNLFEQDETNIVNSRFMTGAAHSIAPDRFKSKVSNKTIIRMEFPLSRVSALLFQSSAIHYFNPTSASFELVAAEEQTLDPSAGFRYDTPGDVLATVPFTPYGHFHLPLNARSVDNPRQIDVTYKRIMSWEANGTETRNVYNEAQSVASFAEFPISTLNNIHNATTNQQIDLSSYLSTPFLLEKIAIELPFQAGPGWLNDRFGIREVSTDLNVVNYAMDVGGPMITCALFRQDNDGYNQYGYTLGYRDLIASATFTTALDVVTGTYHTHVYKYVFDGPTYYDNYYTHEGVGTISTPNVVVRGNVLSGANNFFTGTVKLTMEPSVTSHVWRLSVSSSVRSAPWYSSVTPINSNTSYGYNQIKQTFGLAWSPSGRRSNGIVESTRNILGNQFSLLDASELTRPVPSVDGQFENLARTNNTGTFVVYTDIKTKTSKSPYLLYPSDKLVLCLNKHRAVGSERLADWDYEYNAYLDPAFMTTDGTPGMPGFNVSYGNLTPNVRVSDHDCAIPTGTLRITLYGDLLREDREFHDTLNQRLETAELWETIGEEPVLDQFDVAYRSELSGTYLDRFSLNSVLHFNPNILAEVTGTTTDTTARLRSQLYSHFAVQPTESKTWNNLNANSWTYSALIDVLKKSSKNVNLFDQNEIFWDCRLPNPLQAITVTNPSWMSANNQAFSSLEYSNVIAAPDGLNVVGGYVHDWFMAYPFEPKYTNVKNAVVPWVNEIIPTQVVFGVNPVLYVDRLYADMAFSFNDGFRGTPVAIKNTSGVGATEFIKYFYGIGDGCSASANQYTKGRVMNNTFGGSNVYYCAQIRGWKYGMLNGFQTRNTAVFRRDRYGQFRDMLEQRLDAKFWDEAGAKEGPVQVTFHDNEGNPTNALYTLSSNLSFEATSSLPYSDGIARNRAAFDISTLNISRVSV